jgi:hypothetical protein
MELLTRREVNPVVAVEVVRPDYLSFLKDAARRSLHAVTRVVSG